MPSPRAILRAPRAVSYALVRLIRAIVVIGFVAFALALIVVRFVVFPQIESYRDALASLLTRQLGQPVEIAMLSTGWDGWNPKLVVEGFRVVDRVRANPTPLLLLPKLEMIVSWTSVPLMELRLKELIIDGPRLAIRRDRSGVLRIAGLEFDPAQAADELPITDWVLRQREIVIRDALIVWDDDLRNAPQLVLDRVQFRLENRFGRHRFGLRGTPPAELASPLDLRGDLALGTMRDWQNAQGTVFVRLDYADVAAWREWLPLPGEIASGTGAMRIWFQFAHQEAREIIADVELADVKATLAPGLPEIELAHLSGRVGTRKSGTEREVFTRALSFTTPGGDALDPTQLALTWHLGPGDRMDSAKLEFERLQLAPLVALSRHLPLPDRLRADLARFAPRGTLTHGKLRWSGNRGAPTTFAAAAEFADLGLLAQDAFPGATGLSGRFEATNEGGEIRVESGNATLDLPRVLEAPLAFDTLQSVIKWERRDGSTKVKVERFEVANADMAGDATGTYRTLPTGPGEIEVVAHASRGSVRQAHRYLPRSIDAAAGGWLSAALVDGNVVDARLKIAGNLAEFPFANGKGGKLTFAAKAKGVRLAYAQSWPAIDAIDADVRIDGTRLQVDAARGRVNGVEIGSTRAEIPDFAAAAPMLRIDGEATGPIAGFLRYVNESPVAARIGKITSDVGGGGRRPAGAQYRPSAPATRGHDGQRGVCLRRRAVAGTGRAVPLRSWAASLAFTSHEVAAQRRHGGNPRRAGEARRDQRRRPGAHERHGNFRSRRAAPRVPESAARSRLRQSRLVAQGRPPCARHARVGVREQPQGSGRSTCPHRWARRRWKRCRCASRAATRRARPERTSSWPRTAAWRSSRRTASKAAAAR